ncbi:hypothetical protein CHELA1G2_13917 [Hyphomicrobiales bacterium]|nr:hypothetical protein CHELA1G2_13917 [Hyphomicrobiales bacterium]
MASAASGRLFLLITPFAPRCAWRAEDCHALLREHPGKRELTADVEHQQLFRANAVADGAGDLVRLARLGRDRAYMRSLDNEHVGLLLRPEPDHCTLAALGAMGAEKLFESLRAGDVLLLHAGIVEMPDRQQVGRDRSRIFLGYALALAHSQRALVNAELQRGLEEVIFRLGQPAARQHPFERGKPARDILGIDGRFLINGLNARFGLDQRCIAALQAHNHASKPLGIVESNGEVEAEVAITEAGVSKILPKNFNLASTNASVVKKGQYSAIPGTKGFGVKPPAHLVYGNKLDRSADHKRRP